MKMQKLDPKQVPQVIGLGVLSVGVFGYAVFTFAGSAPKSSPTPVAKTASSSSSSASASTETPSADTNLALSSTGASGDPTKAGEPGSEAAAGISLPGQYNPDPFKAAVKPAGAKTVEVAPKPVEVAPRPTPAAPKTPAPSLPDVRERLTPLPTFSALPPVALGPDRPEVRVTGTSVVDGLNLAILEVGTEHRVVQVGDVVSKGYRVKKIQLQGVVFSKDKDKDHFFRAVGAKSEPEKPDNAEGKSTQF